MTTRSDYATAERREFIANYSEEDQLAADLEAKREQAIRKLGKKWLLHPANKVQKKANTATRVMTQVPGYAVQPCAICNIIHE